ncbi:MAG: DUF559 domain-containing protein [Nocardioides sp.]
MSVVELLTELGGVARRAALLHVVERADIETAVARGEVVRDARGVYALPAADEGVRAAARLHGAVSHTSAALLHGWPVQFVPGVPHVTVSRGRKLGTRGDLVHVHRAELAEMEVRDGVTTPERTLLDCLRTLPFAEALAVADSALRESGCHQLLERVADGVRGPGAPQVRRVASLADGLAANPFESALRSVCLDVPGLSVRPQVPIRCGQFSARPDLVDQRLWLVLEADSFTWHGSRSALASDARRYNQLVAAGWLVLRFTYEDVMFHTDEVRDLLVRVVALAELLKEVPGRPGHAA